MINYLMQKKFSPWQNQWLERSFRRSAGITLMSDKHFFIGHTGLFKICALLLYLLPTMAFAASYEEGKQAYLDKDYDRALEILKPLAEQGNTNAQVTMGLMYDYGHGVPADPVEAIKWYKLAAEQGVPVVQHDLGVKYFQGQGVEQNYLEAAKWWEMSANAGLADSQFNLGLMYYRGIGIPRDFDKAAKLFTQAAEQGHGNAQYSLAVMYAFGQGLDKDYQAAFDLFTKSAEQGVAQAQFNLGVFHENGYGVVKDREKAREWYQKAADQGLKEAIRKLQSLDTHQPASDQQVTAIQTKITNISSEENELNKTEWLRQQRPDNYTIQLGSVVVEKDMLAYVKKHGLAPEGGYIKVIVNDIPRYTAIYGLYETYRQAEQAVNKLPESLRHSSPWIRNIGILQKLLK